MDGLSGNVSDFTFGWLFLCAYAHQALNSVSAALASYFSYTRAVVVPCLRVEARYPDKIRWHNQQSRA